MIHVRIDNHHPTALNIYVDISPSQSSNRTTMDENIYDHLFPQTKTIASTQSKFAQVQPLKKKNYTLKQILDHVETIQQEYEQIVHHHHHQPSSSSSCFFPIKHLTKILKNRRTIKTKPREPSITSHSSSSKPKSPFTFGGETLQWIAFPQPQHDDDNHIYENEVFS